jgi:hypothetical protein
MPSCLSAATIPLTQKTAELSRLDSIRLVTALDRPMMKSSSQQPQDYRHAPRLPHSLFWPLDQ